MVEAIPQADDAHGTHSGEPDGHTAPAVGGWCLLYASVHGLSYDVRGDTAKDIGGPRLGALIFAVCAFVAACSGPTGRSNIISLIALTP